MKRSAPLASFQEYCSQFAFQPKAVKTSAPSTVQKKEEGETGSAEDDPFVAPFPNKYRDKFSSPCDSCFNKCIVCHHSKEERLDMLIIGHNPSEHAWKSGNMYSNPTNRMWKILTGNLVASPSYPGVIPTTLSIDRQNTLPKEYSIGFCDLGVVPGNQSDAFTSEVLSEWRQDLFRRLRNHLKRVCRQSHNDPECSLVCHSPRVVIFSGKKQYLVVARKTHGIAMGRQSDLPSDWPFKTVSHVFVCPSSSGRVVMKKETLLDYYEEAFSEYRSFRSLLCNKQENHEN